MTMTRTELEEAALAFADAGLAPDAEASWEAIAAMGWLSMEVPAALGGLGLGREAAGALHTSLGRSLVRGPAMAQLQVIAALAQAARQNLPDQPELLRRAMDGEIMTASLSGESSGETLRWVPDADRASHVLVDSGERIALVALADCRIEPVVTWDETRRLFDVTPDAPGIVLADGKAAARLSQALHGQLLFALAGDSLGGAGAVLAMTIDYLVTRRQFDRPLAMFQALKHRAADLKTRLSAAEALFWSRADGAPSLVGLGALKALATTTCRDVAEEAIQLHGGIGLTMEHPCHLFLKRALLNSALGGDADHWEESAGRELLAQTPHRLA